MWTFRQWKAWGGVNDLPPKSQLMTCLEDPTLYFSCLPQDIRRYCLTPLLQAGAHLVPLIWSEPQLKAQLTFSDDFYIRTLAVLRDGDLLLFGWNKLHQAKYLYRWNPWDNQFIYQVKLPFVLWMHYEASSDLLLLELMDGKRVVPFISNILTVEAFLATERNWSPDITFTPYRLYFQHPHNFQKWFPNDHGQCVGYYDRHLIFIQDSDNRKLLFYLI